MRWLSEFWGAVRETAFVAAQVVTLGVVAMVLGLMALNAVVHRPVTPATPAGPPRPLSALVATLVPDTPTPGGPRLTTPTPASASTPTPPPSPTALATEAPRLAAVPVPPPLAAEPAQAPPAQPVPPTAAPAPPPPTPSPPPAPTSSVPGQMMKVLPASDGLPARVRAEPNAKAPILIRVPIGASVEVLGVTNGDELQPGNSRWLKVKWKDVTGYVYSTLVGAG